VGSLKDFLRKNEQPVLALLMFGVWAAGYFAIASTTEGHVGYEIPVTQWEREIPFHPNFVWLYLTIYPLFVLPFLFIRNKEFFRLFSMAYITVMCVCYIVYLFYPVRFLYRPTLAVVSFSAFALSIVYGADNAWNCFPSMHVAMSLLAALTILEVHPIRGLLAILLTIFIAASTILIKQHYILDVLASMILTSLVYFFFFRKRILDTLFENFQRAEETLDKWISRRIEQRVTESLEGSLREPLSRLVRSIVRETLREEKPDTGPKPPAPEPQQKGD
jgi:membrane-associated phospholipid phosphatase